MSKKKNRRPRNPIMRKMDDAIDWVKNGGGDPDVQSVVANAINRISVGEFTGYAAMLLAPPARQRLIQRGYKITDSETFERAELWEMGTDDYAELIKVKKQNVDDVSRHLAAERAVRKYLVTQENKLGRPVTAGEFEDKVVAIYERHGISV